MKEKLMLVLEEGKKMILSTGSEVDLQNIKANLLGKKGQLTELMKELPNLLPEERREFGQAVNKAKNELSELIDARRNELKLKSAEVPADFDWTVPGTKPLTGGLHPITQMCYDLNDAFRSMGFEIFQGNDITSEFSAFDTLNFPPAHPARESMDTYWLEGPDTGHERAFFQYEALIVDKDLTFTAGKVMIKSILQKVFGKDVPIRMRAGFFPFVEPGFEIDMQCQVCGGKGCSVCKNVGWIEVMPGGTPHPNVLRSAGLDPDEYTGFYVNIGLDRMVMMRSGVDDVRLFNSADLRFLDQFC